MLKYFKKEGEVLQASFSFSDFVTAFAFMTELAFLAEKIGHHPNWSNVYNTVNIGLTTHDAGNIVTELDYSMAEGIEKIADKHLAKR